MEITEHHPFVSAEAKEKFLRMYDEKAKQWPVPSETRMVDTPYGQTFVRISGPADAPPLVLLSGICGNALFWMRQIKAFSAGYRVYAVDKIDDYGRSIPVRDMESIDDYTGWLDEMLRALGLADVNLIGKSYGSWIAGQYALCRPSRLRKVVMMAPAGTAVPVQESYIRRMATEALSPRELCFWTYEDFARQGEASRKEIDTMVEEGILAGTSFNFRPSQAPTIMDDDELRSIKVPMLFMVGENEKLYSAHEAVARLKKVAPQIKIEVIPGAGHDLNLVQAELVNRKVLEFLAPP
ncbi:MAG TPA: alpha/beta hydrolase [Methanocella sp.]|jgi:pimeloyl-ACP methyl ester carboxylesterase